MENQSQRVDRDGYKRKRRCGECDGCIAKDCGNCRYCLDMPKFGGKRVLKRCCIHKQCKRLKVGNSTSQLIIYYAKKVVVIYYTRKQESILVLTGASQQHGNRTIAEA